MLFKDFLKIFVDVSNDKRYAIIDEIIKAIAGFSLMDDKGYEADTLNRLLSQGRNFYSIAVQIERIDKDSFKEYLDDCYSDKIGTIVEYFRNKGIKIEKDNWENVLSNLFEKIINDTVMNGPSPRKKKNNANGWCNYCNWSNRSIDETEYIIKDDSVIYKDNSHNKINLIDGINLIRKDLLVSGNSVRLAGLSGTGKTRLAQALFDKKIGKDALDKNIVIYGDIGDGLKPDPIEYIQQLVKEKKKVILIVDNCDATMHNKLTKLCQLKGSNVSLMTIEYDVKEDDNIDSNNYYLGPATNETIRELLKRDFGYIAEYNIDTIVKYSDGNYRIAIYLARTIDKNDNMGILKDNDLLDRLFYQGDQKNNEMMKVGGACSLFYSFNINYENTDSNEMNIISKITGLAIDDVCYYIEELEQKQIIQKRGDMRAVLPHILANRLASNYIDHHPINKIIDIISCNSRLLKSFFRRIKNLHNNTKVLKIAGDYLNNLSDTDLIYANDILVEIVRCITILHPTKVLYRIKNIKNDKFFTRDNSNFYEWVLMLAYIAYEEDYFQSAIRIIIRFALSEEKGNNYNSVRDVLLKFFHIYLSGTHAPLQARLDIIDELLNSDNVNEQELGLSLLDSALYYSQQFYGYPLHDNGTKLRDYGLKPIPMEWFKETFEYIDSLLDDNILYDEVREVVESNFYILYRSGCADILDSLVRKNVQKKNWPKIWVMLLAIKKNDKDIIPEKYLKMVNDLIEVVKPSNTKEKLITYLYGGRRRYLGLDVAYDNFDEVNNTIYELGKEVGSNKEELKNNLLTINNDYDLYRANFLTKGIYDETQNIEELVYLLLEIINDNNVRAIKAILNNLINLYYLDNKTECDKLLDEILNNKKYNKYFFALQLSYQLDDKSVYRLVNAIDKGLIDDNDICRIESIVKKLDSEQIILLLDKIKTKTKNGNIIIDTLFNICESQILDERLKKYSREAITKLDFKEYNKMGHRMNTYPLSQLIIKVFNDDKGKIEAKIIFEKIQEISTEGNVSYYDLQDILEPLIKAYPLLFLDVFVNYIGEPPYWIKHFFKGYSGLSDNIINHIDCDLVISWLKETKKDLEISYLLEPYKLGNDNNFKWNELAEYLFSNYSSIGVIQNIVNNIYPTSWENDYSEVMKRRYNLIIALKESKDKNIKKIGNSKLEEYQISLHWHLEREHKEHQDGFGRFED